MGIGNHSQTKRSILKPYAMGCWKKKKKKKSVVSVFKACLVFMKVSSYLEGVPLENMRHSRGIAEGESEELQSSKHGAVAEAPGVTRDGTVATCYVKENAGRLVKCSLSKGGSVLIAARPSSREQHHFYEKGKTIYSTDKFP